MDDKPKSEKKGAGLAVVLLMALLVLPLLYVLSVGPAWRMVEEGYLDYRTVHMAYWPVIKTATISEAADNALTWYVDLWLSEYSEEFAEIESEAVEEAAEESDDDPDDADRE